MANQDSFVVNLNVFCTNQNKQEHSKVTINADEISSVFQLKSKIQDLFNAPVCDQKLSLLGQPLNDPTAKLSDLYLRDGDNICVEFLEKVDIEEFNVCIKKLKDFISSTPPCTSDGCYVHVPPMNNVDRLEDLYADIAEPLENLDIKFCLWKTVKAKANRHYFVQEGGLEVLMEILTFSQKKYTWFSSSNYPAAAATDEIRDDDAVDDDDDDNDADTDYNDDLFYRSDELVQSFNEWQMILCTLVLQTLWNFMETGPDTRLVLSMGGLQYMVDAYMKSDNYSGPSSHLAVNLRESALGCLCGCVEYDKKSQFEVADNLTMMKKLCQIIEPKGFYRKHECCLAANTIFYVSFNQKAIKRLICSGFYEEILAKMQAWNQEFDSALLVLVTWYYCLLFLARIRSSTLCTIPREQSIAIDSVIERFLQEHKPRRIAEYEEQELYVWMTLAPIVHMAFAAGPKTRKATRERLGRTNDESLNSKKLKNLVEKFSDDSREQQEFVETEPDSTDLPSLFSFNIDSVAKRHQNLHETAEIELGNPGSARWPGSPAVQKLAIFALQHTLHSKDNRQLLISEDLHSYLLCLQWQLKQGTPEYEKLKEELLAIGEDLQVPTLRVVCKSVLANMNGLDSVM